MLFPLVSWPYFRRHVVRTALTVAGIALGVAVLVGMHTANQSVLFAFSQSMDRIAGKADLQVTAGEAGFSEDVLELVQSAAAVRVAVPVIEAAVESTLEGQGDLLLLGVDMTGDRSLRDYDLEGGDEAVVDDPLIFLAQPDSLIVTKDLADRNGLASGNQLRLKTAEGEKVFTVRGIMTPTGLGTAFGGNLAVMDVYAAQRMLGRGRTFDRIDLAVQEGTTVDDAQRELRTLLGAGFEVVPPATRGRQAQAMVAGYTTMVSISSVFALFISMFIIYNSFATAVTERRFEIGVLRSLGATRGQVVRLFLGESLVLGLIGSGIGLAVGLFLAGAIASAISSLIGELYGVAKLAGDVATDRFVLATAMAVGTVTSLLAALIPALGAAHVDPVHALKKGGVQRVSLRAARVRIAAATVAALVAAACLTAAEYRPLFYVGYALTIVVPLLLGPMLSLRLAQLLRPLLKWLRPVEGALAADSLIQTPRRTSASVSALMLSLALVLAFAGMARAVYGSIVEWMDSTLNPDLFVMPSQRLDLRTTRFPAAMASEIASVPGVARVQMFRYNRMTVDGDAVMIAAIEVNSFRETTRARPVAGEASEMYVRTAAGKGVIVSENFAQLRDRQLGDTVEIPAPRGTISLPIVGIVVDYTDQQGTVFMDRSVFLAHWEDDSVSDFHVWVTSDATIDAVQQRIIERYAGERHVFVLTNEESRRYILGIADQWFGLMDVQIAIAVLIAVLGIANSLTVSILDRQRELGVLRAVGATRSQIRHTIWLEAAAVAVIGLVLGSMFGAINLYYLLDIVQRDAMGLRLEYRYPFATMLALVPVMLAAAFIAALWPSEAAVRRPVVEALAYE